MTELLLPYLAQLGLAGIVFMLLLALAQLGLTQFFKVLAQRFTDKFSGLWVLGLSVVLGGVLGGLMLSKVAPVLGIDIRAPWGGVLAGMVLAAVVSGLVSYQQQRTAEKALSKADALAVLLGQLSAAQPVAVAVPPPEVLPTETLTPITPEEASRMTRVDWPAVIGDDAPLVTDRPGSSQPY